MKKLIATIFAAALMAAGLVGFTSSPAAANCTPTQYSGCIQTRTFVSAKSVVAQGKKAKVCARVKAKGSNAKPVGTMRIIVKRNAGGFYFQQSKTLRGGKACVKTPRLFKRGGYEIKAKYSSPRNSRFINSYRGGSFDVVG